MSDGLKRALVVTEELRLDWGRCLIQAEFDVAGRVVKVTVPDAERGMDEAGLTATACAKAWADLVNPSLQDGTAPPDNPLAAKLAEIERDCGRVVRESYAIEAGGVG